MAHRNMGGSYFICLASIVVVVSPGICSSVIFVSNNCTHSFVILSKRYRQMFSILLKV